MSSSPNNPWDEAGSSSSAAVSASRQAYAEEDQINSDDDNDLLAADPLDGELGNKYGYHD